MNRLTKLFLISLTLLVLSACGGGGGGGGGDAPQELVYSGNTNSAVITLENAATLVGNILYGGEVGANIPLAVMLTEQTNPRSSGAVVQAKLLHSISQNIQDSIFKNNVLLPDLVVGVDLNEPLECDSGSGNLVGTLNDSTFTGTLTVTYINCLLDGVIYNGTGTLRIDGIDLSIIEITDATMTFTLMSISSPEFSGSISGTMRIQSMIYSNTEKMTLNYVAKDNLTGKMYKFENMIITIVYDYMFSPTYKTETYTGSPARVYDSIHGYVDVDTLTPLAYSSIILDNPDIDGVMLFMGAAGASIQVTVLSEELIQLELDIDGIPGYEESRILFWEELAVNANTDLTDADAIHVLRVPITGVSLTGVRSNGYFGQTFKLYENATAEKLTVYFRSGVINFRVLLVEVMTDPEFHPTNVLFESDTISVTQPDTPVIVNFGGVSLNAGQTYAWILDGYVEYDGTDGYSMIYVADYLGDNMYPDGFIFSRSISPVTGTREEHFAGYWYPSTGYDMSFILEYILN